jgi:serine/threonine protein kinase
MAPEVLTNPCTRLEEKTATKEQLDLRNIVPYTSKVDVWATGVLAHELVTGRPPFEVENEAQTVAMILQSDNIVLDNRFSLEWADFIRCARPPASSPWLALFLQPLWIRDAHGTWAL